MTIAIIAWNPATEELGAAVASGSIDGTATTVAARPGLGIAASQGIKNPDLAPSVLDRPFL